MRWTFAVAVLAVGLSVPGAAQEFYHARLGVTGATSLVTDRIINTIDVRQNFAPTVLIGASLPVAQDVNASLEVSLATGSFDAEEGAASQSLGTVRTMTATLGAEGRLTWNLRWRAGLGIIRYWPSEDQGIFRRGGPTDFVLTGGVDYTRQLSDDWAVLGGVRYDYHRFTTEELQARGFSQSQQVHRVGLLVGIARTIS